MSRPIINSGAPATMERQSWRHDRWLLGITLRGFDPDEGRRMNYVRLLLNAASGRNIKNV